MKSINPATDETIHIYTAYTKEQVQANIAKTYARFRSWKNVPFTARTVLMKEAAVILHHRETELAELMADEMGKPLTEGMAEIKKCATACDYYAENAERMLADEPIKTEARKSFITYQPIGVILAIMPWNFPFWQVFRFAAPNLMAGNTGLLKHSSNVSGCAMAIEQVFRDAGFPEGCFTTLLIDSERVGSVIEDPRVAAVTLTGSNAAGRAVAAKAGECLKKSVLELGGSDAYVVLEDADIKAAATECAKSRLINGGQSCIAAKRFIVVTSVREEFEQHFLAYFNNVLVGNPKDQKVQVGPMARTDLRDMLHKQVEESVIKGARILLGGIIPEGKGAYYPPTVLGGVTPGMPAFDEEMFGPVAAIVEARNEQEAFTLANHSSFGLGSAIFTSDLIHAEALAKHALDAGQTFVNALVRSDPRLPFGGVKESGYGRELGTHGIREFVNAKTVYIA